MPNQTNQPEALANAKSPTIGRLQRNAFVLAQIPVASDHCSERGRAPMDNSVKNVHI